MDPILCCAIGLCCPPASVEQFDAVVQLMERKFKDKKRAKAAALQAWPEFVRMAEKLHAAGLAEAQPA